MTDVISCCPFSDETNGTFTMDDVSAHGCKLKHSIRIDFGTEFAVTGKLETTQQQHNHSHIIGPYIDETEGQMRTEPYRHFSVFGRSEGSGAGETHLVLHGLLLSGGRTCTINHNHNCFGATVYLHGAGAYLNTTDCIFEGTAVAYPQRNLAFYGGSIWADSGSSIYVLRTAFHHLVAQGGGAIMLQGTTVDASILHSTFESNTASLINGGAILMGEFRDVTIVNTSFTGNAATSFNLVYGKGGAIYGRWGQLKLNGGGNNFTDNTCNGADGSVQFCGPNLHLVPSAKTTAVVSFDVCPYCNFWQPADCGNYVGACPGPASPGWGEDKFQQQGCMVCQPDVQPATPSSSSSSSAAQTSKSETPSPSPSPSSSFTASSGDAGTPSPFYPSPSSPSSSSSSSSSSSPSSSSPSSPSSFASSSLPASSSSCDKFPASAEICLDVKTAGQCGFQMKELTTDGEIQCQSCYSNGICPVLREDNLPGTSVWPKVGYWVDTEKKRIPPLACPAPSL
jgi:predicted outer membrane repeat protein